jgi:hypothetical protein
MIMELLETAGHVGIALAGVSAAHALGVARERNRKPKPVMKERPQLHCGCNHQLSFHEGLGSCKFVMRDYLRKKDGMPIKKDGEPVETREPCVCQQYTGDLPEDWYSRDAMRELEIADGTVVRRAE